ncbi:uncharacterized protein EKO05_0004113 [Ascochyta rabiei]|uniref:uncharacterized protein n=1 Tax=Didymella rabiei TaxID=5454 RepID=UPI002205D4E9|nr:uncharacterized protein EKO05_0004113 [Ascochyta rabiei]UPX13612.1 hypothetical protein EKO05_0004113 [Ascochyta rabiei]
MATLMRYHAYYLIPLRRQQNSTLALMYVWTVPAFATRIVISLSNGGGRKLYASKPASRCLSYDFLQRLDQKNLSVPSSLVETSLLLSSFS